MNNNRPFGGLVVVLDVEPDQLPPIQGNYLQFGFPIFHWYGLYGMFETVTKLFINSCPYHDDPTEIEHNNVLKILR